MAGQTLGANSWQTTNAAANQSTVYVTITLYSNGWSYDGYTASHSVNIGGNVYGGDGPRTLYSPNNWSTTYSHTFNHDANGYRGAVGTSAAFSGSGPYVPGSLSADGGTQGAVDYDRKPGTPPSLTATVNSNKTITVNVGSVSSPAGTPTYYVAYTQNGGAYTGQQGSTGTTFTFSGLTPGQNYGFRAFATNSDGTSGFVYTSSTVFLPSGGKRWDGTNWVPVQMFKRWDGSNWVDISMAKRWNGTAWVDLT